MYKKYFKRPMDFILSLLALIVLSPLIVIVAISVKLKLGSPVLFKQQRPGKDGKIFYINKFRTMTQKCEKNGDLLPDELRLTKFGKFLRSASLDELPELFNILKGEMSIVGPRPQLIKDMVFFDENQMKRQSVLPGLSGLAQINGRNCITWENRINYDLEYIENITFFGDVRIIILTILKVFKKEGIHSEGMATSEDFGDYLLRENKIKQDEYLEKINKSHELMFMQ